MQPIINKVTVNQANAYGDFPEEVKQWTEIDTYQWVEKEEDDSFYWNSRNSTYQCFKKLTDLGLVKSFPRIFGNKIKLCDGQEVSYDEDDDLLMSYANRKYVKCGFVIGTTMIGDTVLIVNKNHKDMNENTEKLRRIVREETGNSERITDKEHSVDVKITFTPEAMKLAYQWCIENGYTYIRDNEIDEMIVGALVDKVIPADEIKIDYF